MKHQGLAWQQHQLLHVVVTVQPSLISCFDPTPQRMVPCVGDNLRTTPPSPAGWVLCLRADVSTSGWCRQKAGAREVEGRGEKLCVRHTGLLLHRSVWFPVNALKNRWPLPSSGGGEIAPPRAEADLQWSHDFTTSVNQRITVPSVSEWDTEVGCSSYRTWRTMNNDTFYIIHYMWLCTICWYPRWCWNIWFLAFSRRHEIKMYDSHSYLWFCDCRDKLHSVV